MNDLVKKGLIVLSVLTGIIFAATICYAFTLAFLLAGATLLAGCTDSLITADEDATEFGGYRRLSKDYEYLPEVSEAMVQLSAIRIMIRRLA